MLYSSDEIKEILPHRYPFLLIDRIIDLSKIDGQVVIKAQKCVSSNEGFFQGHFPLHQVMPGVLILEAMAQAGAFYVLSLDEYKGKIAYFAGADKVKFRRQVIPGDVLNIEVTLGEVRRGIGYGFAKAYVEESLACQAELTFVIK